MQRITEADLRNVVERLSRLTGESFTLSHAYGGVCLQHTDTHNSVFSCGHIPKRALWDRMQAFIAGIEFEKNRDKANTEKKT